MNGGYGVPRDIFAKMKFAGFLAWKLGVIGGSALGGAMLGSHIFPSQQFLQMIMFMILSPVIVIYLVLPANGGQSNIQILMTSLRRRKHRWVSFDWTPEKGVRQ